MAQAADDPSACRVVDLPPAASTAAAVATSIPAAAAATSKMVATCTAASPVSTTSVCHGPRPCHSLSVLPRSRYFLFLILNTVTVCPFCYFRLTFTIK